jgi:hypothetical protein
MKRNDQSTQESHNIISTERCEFAEEGSLVRVLGNYNRRIPAWKMATHPFHPISQIEQLSK